MSSLIARTLAITAVGLALLPQPALAQAPLPSVDEVLERYAAALGGRDRVLNATSSRAVGRVAVPAVGMEGEVEVLVAGPQNMLQRIDIAGFGESVTGLADGHAWSVDPMQGARLVEGIEAEQLRHSADPTAALRDAVHFTEREVVGYEEVDGERCVKVRFVWHSGREMFDCYSTETGLMISSRTAVEGPMGSVDVTTRALEYRELGGIMVATRLVQSMMGIEQTVTIESVEYGTVGVDDVAPPPAVRTLLEGAHSH